MLCDMAPRLSFIHPPITTKEKSESLWMDRPLPNSSHAFFLSLHLPIFSLSLSYAPFH